MSIHAQYMFYFFVYSSRSLSIIFNLEFRSKDGIKDDNIIHPVYPTELRYDSYCNIVWR